MTVAEETKTRLIDVVRRSSRNERRLITVPEWENANLYFGKLTTADVQGVADRNPKNTHERNMYLLVAKAELEDGAPAFDIGDLHFLKTEADFMITERLIDFMFQVAVPTVADAKEEIKKDPTSAPV